MNMLRQFNEAMEYIEANLCAEFELDEAAKRACISGDSFMRFFIYMTGMTLHEYIRRRRLTLAADEVAHTSGRVIDIAVKYGYESADAFSRAFFRQHGITPAAYRKSGGKLNVYPPASFHITVKGANKMGFRLIESTALEVFGVSKVFEPNAFPNREAIRHQMWDEKGDSVPETLCGAKWDQPESTILDGTWFGLWRGGKYMIAREKEYVVHEQFEKQLIPAGTWAAFTTERGGKAWEEFPRLFEQIFDCWLPASGYTLRNEDILEVYHLWGDHRQRRENRYYEVWVPVMPK